MIHVLAVITANAGKRAEVLAAFNANVPAVRAEKGCIEYGAAVDAEGAPSIQVKYGEDMDHRNSPLENRYRVQKSAACPG